MAKKDLSHAAMPTGMQSATRYYEYLQKFGYNLFCNYSFTFTFIATLNGPSGNITQSHMLISAFTKSKSSGHSTL